MTKLITDIASCFSRMMGWAPDGPHGKRKEVATSILLCFGGGILMATSLVHMVPGEGYVLTDGFLVYSSLPNKRRAIFIYFCRNLMRYFYFTWATFIYFQNF